MPPPTRTIQYILFVLLCKNISEKVGMFEKCYTFTFCVILIEKHTVHTVLYSAAWAFSSNVLQCTWKHITGGRCLCWTLNWQCCPQGTTSVLLVSPCSTLCFCFCHICFSHKLFLTAVTLIKVLKKKKVYSCNWTLRTFDWSSFYLQLWSPGLMETSARTAKHQDLESTCGRRGEP